MVLFVIPKGLYEYEYAHLLDVYTSESWAYLERTRWTRKMVNYAWSGGKICSPEVDWVISRAGQPARQPNLKKPTALRGAVGVWDCESSARRA